MRVLRIDVSDPRFAALQRLRYDVYCLEQEFLNPLRFPDRREHDEYDTIAHHFGMWDDDDELVGTMRFVPDSPLGFPMERFVARESLEQAGILRSRTACLSRLVLRRDVRDPRAASGPHPLCTLFREGARQSRGLGLDTVIASLEPALVRLLARYGFVVQRFGRSFDWYGTVVPCVLTALPLMLMSTANVFARSGDGASSVRTRALYDGAAAAS